MKKTLTRRQKDFYDKLVEFTNKNGRPPGMEEMKAFTGARSTGTPHFYCQQLIKAGWAKKEGMHTVALENENGIILQ